MFFLVAVRCVFWWQYSALSWLAPHPMHFSEPPPTHHATPTPTPSPQGSLNPDLSPDDFEVVEGGSSKKGGAKTFVVKIQVGRRRVGGKGGRGDLGLG